MIVCTPGKVKERFGTLFCGRFLVMVDQRAGMAEIIEQCTARGPVEWDAANRIRAGGATLSCRVEGTTLTLRAKLLRDQ